MKKYLILLWMMVITLSCDKLPSNGDLDGQWQLMELNRKSSPTDEAYNEKSNVKDQKIYWRFQLDLLMIHTSKAKLNGRTNDTSARFRHQGGELQLTQTYIHEFDKDELITDPNTTILESIGITGNTETFKVEQLNNERMVLVNNKKQLIFRKF